MAPPTLVTSSLAAVAMESALYGIFFVLTCWSAYLLVRRQHSLKARPAMFGQESIYASMQFFGGVLLFLTVTPHWVLIVYRSQEAFARPNTRESAEVFYEDMTIESYTFKSAISALVPIFADWLLIYRLWAIWDRSFAVAAFPVLSLLAGIACGVVTIYAENQKKVGDAESTPLVQELIMGCYLSILLTSLYCCSLIVWRLWRTCRHQGAPRGVQLWRVMILFIQSAGLYMAMTLVCFVVQVLGSTAEYFVGEIMVPITGIAFMSINVFIGMGYTASTQVDHIPYGQGMTWDQSERHRTRSIYDKFEMSNPSPMKRTKATAVFVDSGTMRRIYPGSSSLPSMTFAAAEEPACPPAKTYTSSQRSGRKPFSREQEGSAGMCNSYDPSLHISDTAVS